MIVARAPRRATHEGLGGLEVLLPTSARHLRLSGWGPEALVSSTATAVTSAYPRT